jgi:hypothetical protein
MNIYFMILSDKIKVKSSSYYKNLGYDINEKSHIISTFSFELVYLTLL